MPDEFVSYGQRWSALHPDWKLYDWTDASLPNLRNERLGADKPRLRNDNLWRVAPRLAPGRVGQLRADIVRLELLWRFGGVWLDADMEPRKPIGELLDDVELFAAWETDGVWINNAILGATAAHPFIDELIRRMPRSVVAHPGAQPNVTTGPQYVTRQVRSLKPDIAIFPSAWFYPYRWDELDRAGEDFPDAYAIHRWNNRRTHAGAAS
jgi:mannosyltransferase OCH1-like enzyme